jgi:hypothetical protein
LRRLPPWHHGPRYGTRTRAARRALSVHAYACSAWLQASLQAATSLAQRGDAERRVNALPRGAAAALLAATLRACRRSYMPAARRRHLLRQQLQERLVGHPGICRLAEPPDELTL